MGDSVWSYPYLLVPLVICFCTQFGSTRDPLETTDARGKLCIRTYMVFPHVLIQGEVTNATCQGKANYMYSDQLNTQQNSHDLLGWLIYTATLWLLLIRITNCQVVPIRHRLPISVCMLIDLPGFIEINTLCNTVHARMFPRIGVSV